jgi:hypothetical protein
MTDLHHHSAVNAQDLAGDVSGFGGSKKRDRGGDVVGCAGLAERDLRLDCFLNLVRQSRGHVGGNKSGRNRVDGNAATGQFARERFRKPDQPGLARGVISLAGVADQTDHRSNINDASAALLDHGADNRLREIECAAQIRVDDRVPIFDRHAHRQTVARHAGVVDEDVDLAEVFENLRADFLHGGMIGNIDCVRLGRVGALGVYFIGRLFRIRFRSTNRRNPRALTGKADGDGVPNPPSRAGNNRSLIFESHTALIARDEERFCKRGRSIINEYRIARDNLTHV